MKEAKEKARALLKEKNKERAKIALQSCKVSEKYLQQAQQEELNLESLIVQVEQAQV